MRIIKTLSYQPVKLADADISLAKKKKLGAIFLYLYCIDYYLWSRKGDERERTTCNKGSVVESNLGSWRKDSAFCTWGVCSTRWAPWTHQYLIRNTDDFLIISCIQIPNIFKIWCICVYLFCPSHQMVVLVAYCYGFHRLSLQMCLHLWRKNNTQGFTVHSDCMRYCAKKKKK